MTKAELVAKIASTAGITKSQAEKALETAETNPSNAFSACDLVSPTSLAIFATNSAFVISVPPQG